MMLSPVAAHAAIEAKDARYDGVFFTGVTSTGVYCRCVCPARTPKPANRRFFPSAAAAEAAGFRPCLLCRPERAPGFAPIDEASRLAGDALRLIQAGALEESGIGALAARLGVSDRHLRRVMRRVLGASPQAIAQTHRLLTAKRLLHETRLGLTHVAFASGFGSVRRFNAAFQENYRLAPSRLRRSGPGAKTADGAKLSLHLAARGGLDAERLCESLTARAVPGLEAIGADGVYRRTLVIGADSGVFEVAPDGAGVRVTLSEGLAPALRKIVALARAAFDLDADMAAIDRLFEGHGPLAMAAGPRLHGELDPYETAVRTVLGQQVTRAAAKTLAARLIAAFGAPVETGVEGLTHQFPSPARLAEASIDQLAGLGMPGKRAGTVLVLAQAVASGACVLQRGAVAAGRAGLAAIPGIGPWTIEYVALRGLGDPDAFPLGDAVLDKRLSGADPACWRPFRAYAAMRLWALANPQGAKNNVADDRAA
jgi:AraC family transcriptional regulator, regulatory protein of adaptative response / DNA-3-methyladenine glycosylase II